MTPSTARALAINTARPIVRRGLALGWSADRIAAHAEVSAGTVRKLVEQMRREKASLDQPRNEENP